MCSYGNINFPYGVSTEGKIVKGKDWLQIKGKLFMLSSSYRFPWQMAALRIPSPVAYNFSLAIYSRLCLCCSLLESSSFFSSYADSLYIYMFCKLSLYILHAVDTFTIQNKIALNFTTVYPSTVPPHFLHTLAYLGCGLFVFLFPTIWIRISDEWEMGKWMDVWINDEIPCQS